MRMVCAPVPVSRLYYRSNARIIKANDSLVSNACDKVFDTQMGILLQGSRSEYNGLIHIVLGGTTPCAGFLLILAAAGAMDTSTARRLLFFSTAHPQIVSLMWSFAQPSAATVTLFKACRLIGGWSSELHIHNCTKTVQSGLSACIISEGSAEVPSSRPMDCICAAHSESIVFLNTHIVEYCMWTMAYMLP
jgi:hypothetical protein